MKRTAGTGAKGEQNGQPFLRFYHSEALRIQTLSILDTLEAAEDPTRHREALADLVLELTETGLTYFFIKPLEAAKVGFLSQQSTKLGISGILRVMGPVSRRVIGGMDAPQLRSVSGFMRQLME